MSAADPAHQGSLFDGSAPSIDPTFSTLTRRALDATAWVDHGPGWLGGSHELFRVLADNAGWAQQTRLMYGKDMLEPRLTAGWARDSELLEAAPILDEMRAALSDHYGVRFSTGNLNWYRDGRDSVAWHRDKIPASVKDPIVALVSLGAPRRFLLRPRGGGKSVGHSVAGGDLVVTGGTTQRGWEHTVPKVASAGPRISIAFRHR
jgi:alkylated DNA repair dioxygenase AlkB